MIEYKIESRKSHFSHQELFQQLTSDDLCLIEDGQFEVKYKEGELIFKQGSPCTHIAIITKGFAKTYLEGLQNNATISFLKPNDIICNSELYTSLRHNYSVRAIKETVVSFIEIKNIKKLINHNKLFAEKYIVEINKTLNYSYQKLLTYSQQSHESRVANVLVYLHEEIYNNGECQIDISKNEISEYAFMSIENVFRILKQFEKKEIIMNVRQKIEITEIERLKNIALRGLNTI